MGIDHESALEAAERRARESNRLAGESKQRQGAQAATEAQAADQAAAELIGQCLDRLARAGWPEGEEIAPLESVTEPVGLLRNRQERRRFVDREVWMAPIGVGWKTRRTIDAIRNPGWMRIYRDSVVAIERDGTLWHGPATEKTHRTWSRLDPPSTEGEVEALTDVLGAILAKYVPA